MLNLQSTHTPFTGYGLQMGSGRTRIRTRVFGLEIRSDIQTTLYVQIKGRGLQYMKFMLAITGDAHT